MYGTKLWSDPPIIEGNADLTWELFHENSKVTQFDIPPSDHDVLSQMAAMAESLAYHGYPIVELPTALVPMEMSVGEAILNRSTAKQFTPATLDLNTAGTLLHAGYGITRDQRALGYPRPFRAVPSGGALYPLELYVHCARTEGFPEGLYHYNPTENNLRLLRSGDHSEELAQVLVQKNFAHESAMVLFITALTERTTFKYGDRGYRFALLEAGHVAQNMNLAAISLGLGSVNLGGFYDRRADDFLDIDGLTHATIYMLAVGKQSDPSAPSCEA